MNEEEKPNNDPVPSSEGGMDHVFAELKQVLSSLTSPDQELTPPPSLMDEPPPKGWPSFAEKSEEKLDEPPLKIDEPMIKGEKKGLPSDHDFWSGNVLGWTDEKPNKEGGNGFLHSEDPLNGNGKDEFNHFDLEEPVLPEPQVPSPAYLNPFADLPPEEVEEPEPVEEKKAEAPSKPEDWPVEIPEDIREFLPEPPQPPTLSIPTENSEAKKEAKPEPELEEDIPPLEFYPRGKTYVEGSIPSPTIVPTSAVLSSAEDLQEEKPITTNNAPSVPMVDKDEPADLEFEDDEIKPKGLIQIACVYPDGQEKAGQQFVTYLKERAEKSNFHLNLRAVYVQPWVAGNIDLTSWMKSAALSGADIVYILFPKKERAHFRPGLPSSQPVKLRLVAVENIEFKALYADLVLELTKDQ